MPQHELLHFTIVSAAPMRAHEKRPANLDLAPRLVVSIKARRANDAFCLAIPRDERATARQRFIEESAKDLGCVAIARGMLLPDQGIGCGGKERIEVVGAQRAKCQ